MPSFLSELPFDDGGYVFETLFHGPDKEIDFCCTAWNSPLSSVGVLHHKNPRVSCQLIAVVEHEPLMIFAHLLTLTLSPYKNYGI